MFVFEFTYENRQPRGRSIRSTVEYIEIRSSTAATGFFFLALTIRRYNKLRPRILQEATRGLVQSVRISYNLCNNQHSSHQLQELR